MTHQPNVLIVDDDVYILSAFESFLRKEHCKMLACASADDALRTLESQQVHLVISDIRLKYQSGITLLIRIKQLYPKLPVIVITGHPYLVTEKDVRLYGAKYYFRKPLELGPLRYAVRECLHLSGPSSEKINQQGSLTTLHHHIQDQQ